MTNVHLTDEMIQAYLWDPQSLDPENQAHISTCDHCRSLAAGYQVLFLQVEKIEPPRFDDGLAQQVISQILMPDHPAMPGLLSGPGKKTSVNSGTRAAWPLIFLAVLAAGLVGGAWYLLRGYIGNITSGISTTMTYFIVATIILIMAFLIFDEYRKYIKQINSLDFQ